MKPSLLLACLLLAGCTTVYRVHEQDGADDELRRVVIARDTETLDLEAAGKTMVKNYGRRIAWRAVLDLWEEQTGGPSQLHVDDVLWLQDHGAHVQTVAWLIRFKQDWLK